MKATRVVAGGLVLAMGAVTGFAGPSGAAAHGASKSEAATSLLQIDVGDAGAILGLDLVTESSTATLGKDGAGEAVARLAPVRVRSGLLNLDVAAPAVEARSTGGEQSTKGPAVNLAKPAGVTIPAGAVAGRVTPGAVSAIVSDAVAKATLGASVQDLSLVGGLVSAEDLTSSLASMSGSVDASGSRTLKAGEIVVLDLGALLAGIGLDVADLPLAVVSNLLATLDVTLAGIADGSTLSSTTETLSGQITGLTALLPTSTVQAKLLDDVTGALPLDPVTENDLVTGTPVGGVIDAVDAEAEKLLASVGLPVDATVEQVLGVIADLQKTLTDTLKGALDALGAAPLLTVGGIDIDVATKAAGSVTDSSAVVRAAIGSVRVGELGALAGINVLGTVEEVQAKVGSLLGTVDAQLGGVLGKLSPKLSGIVDVGLFEKVEDVTNVDGVTTAHAALTAVTARVTPPADLAAIVGDLTAGVGLGELLAEAGATVPVLEPAMATLTKTLGGVSTSGVRASVVDLGALASGVVVRLGTVSSTSTFAPAQTTTGGPATPTGGELPRTGPTETAALAALGLLLIAAGMGVPQWATAAAAARRRRD